jgi:hypothetical protein
MFVALAQGFSLKIGAKGVGDRLPVFGAKVSALKPDQPAVALGYCFGLSFGAPEGVRSVTWNGNHDDL